MYICKTTSCFESCLRSYPYNKETLLVADRPTVLTISIAEMSWITRIKTSNKIVDVNANRRAAYYADTHPKWLAPLIANECAKRIIFIVNFDNVVFTDESQFHFCRCTQKTIDQNFVDLSKM